MPANNSTNGAKTLVFNGLELPNAKNITFSGSNLAVGTHDLYTVPAGKKAIIYGSVTGYNQSAGNITWSPNIKISGSYYFISTSSTTTTATVSVSNLAIKNIILDAGESFSVITTTTNGLNVWAQIIEFDATASIKSSKVTAPASGDNTIYTCPSGYTARLFRPTGAQFDAASGMFANDSGGALSTTYYIVPSGQSVGVNYQASPATSVNDNTSQNIVLCATLGAGDFISLNLSGAGTASLAWVNVVETIN